jgi:hypothetical protein
MEQAAASNTTNAQQKWTLGKLLLTKFGVLHDFHIHQMEAYTYACTPLTLEASFEVDTEARVVIYRLKTKHHYTKKGEALIKRKKYDPRKLKTTFKYNKETAAAVKNLKLWTKHLLWENTKIEVYIDDAKF